MIRPGFQSSTHVLWNLDKAKANILAPSQGSNSSRLRSHGNCCFGGGSAFRSPLGSGAGRFPRAPTLSSCSRGALTSVLSQIGRELIQVRSGGCSLNVPSGFSSVTRYLAIAKLRLLARLLAGALSRPTLSQRFSRRLLGFPKLRAQGSPTRGRSRATAPSPSSVTGEQSGVRVRYRIQRKLEGLLFHRETLLAKNTTCGVPTQPDKRHQTLGRRLLPGSCRPAVPAVKDR